MKKDGQENLTLTGPNEYKRDKEKQQVTYLKYL